MALSRQSKEIEILIRARYPIIYIVTWEEMRAVAEITRIAQEREKRVLEWSITTGLAPAGALLQAGKLRDPKTKDPLAALDQVIDDLEPAIYIFKDLHPFLNRQNNAVVRRLREIANNLKHTQKTVIVIAPCSDVPMELEKDVTVIDFDMPGHDEIDGLLTRIQSDVVNNPNIQVELDPETREKLIAAALGLTLTEAENVFAKALVTARKLDVSQIRHIFEEKKQIIRKSGLLEYIETGGDLNGVGGLDKLKDWLRKRTIALSSQARQFGLPAPRGILLLGVQGCGKSLTAKTIGQLWNQPLMRFDVGRVFNSLVGTSESNIRRAIQVVESVSPAILWIDEIDKAFSRQSGNTDGGTSTRVFGTFLTWLSEKKSPVFVVATANDIRNLPPELLRKGRLDEIFFVDLPSHWERTDIFRIHLAKRKRNPAKFDLDALAKSSEGFSGAEIEECIVSALFDSFYERHDVTTEVILNAIRQTVPLSKTMQEEINFVRTWCEGRARNATSLEASLPGIQPAGALTSLSGSTQTILDKEGEACQ